MLAVPETVPDEETVAASVAKSITDSTRFPAMVSDPVRSTSITAKAWLKVSAPKLPVSFVTGAATRKSQSPRCEESPEEDCTCCVGSVKARAAASEPAPAE